jgi:hypothetical protein
MQKHAKTRAKTRTEGLLDEFMGNSLPTFALNREIPYSHSLLEREIASHMSQKIAKFQANLCGADGRF